MSLVVSILINRVLDSLASTALEQLQINVNLVMGVEGDVRNLSSNFSAVQKLLVDADRRSLNEKAVGVWLGRLEDVAYEMENILDEWNLIIQKPQTSPGDHVDDADHDQGKVYSCIPSFWANCVKPVQQLPRRRNVASKIRDINAELERILSDANRFNFISSCSGAHFEFTESRPSRNLSVSVIDESRVYGRDFDKNSLLNLLLKGESGSDPVKVVSIVGVGGSGKTTLAQILFNNLKVRESFKIRKWVCVSDPFDDKRIANALLESPRKSVPNLSELDPMFQLIKTQYSGPRFLVVLDDVWTEDSTRWLSFKDALRDGAPGSVILVTTRSQRVARTLHTEERHIHRLGLMSTEDCWKVLKHKALYTRPETAKKVKKIGMKIAEKCKGLPLGASFMGGLLQFKDTVEEWRTVSNSKIWQMEEAAMELFPHFYMSYNELSPQLKRCFRYCAVFPKDARIGVDQLIRLWMAQGCLGVPTRKGDEMLEMKGRECFKILAMRSFFQDLAAQVDDESRIISCKMHDIVHDFAQFLTKNECQIFDDTECRSEGYLNMVRARHVTWLGTNARLNLSSLVLNSERVQSFLISSDAEVPADLFTSLKSARAMSLSSPTLGEVPREIGRLMHLRYLNLSHSSIRVLPDTLCDLYYLETLDVSFCNFLSCFPSRIGELAHLRHLIYEDTEELQKKMPSGFERLTTLRTLTEFVAGGLEFNDIAKLKSLDQIEEMRITVRGSVKFADAKLGKKECLRKLELYFHGAGRHGENASSVERMQPPPNLQIIEFGNYGGRQLPEWIVSDPLFANLRMLNIFSASNMSSLPVLGNLHSLEYLWLRKIPNIRKLDRRFLGLPETVNITDDSEVEYVAFPSLKKLQIEELENWKTWEDVTEDDLKCLGALVMPNLQELTISQCDLLENLPDLIIDKASSLKRLVIRSCRILQANHGDGHNHEKLSKIPQLII